MSNTISDKDFIRILEETFEHKKDFSFNPTGDSMKPMLNGISDTVVLTKKGERLKKYDVAMFVRRSDNALILHRVVKVTGNNYTMSGDNQYYFDTDVPHGDILAVVKSFVRNKKTIRVSDFSYRVYCRIILIKKHTRIFLSKLYHKVFK